MDVERFQDQFQTGDLVTHNDGLFGTVNAIDTGLAFMHDGTLSPTVEVVWESYLVERRVPQAELHLLNRAIPEE